MSLHDLLSDLADSARQTLERAEAQVKKSADDWTHRLSQAVETLQMSKKTAVPPPPPAPQQPAASLQPTASTWRAEEHAHWLDEMKRQPARWHAGCGDEAQSERTAVERSAAIQAATSRLRRSLMLQEARRREEMEAAPTDGGMDDETEGWAPADVACPSASTPAAAEGQLPPVAVCDDEASLVYEDLLQEVETQKTAAAARSVAAAEARAAVLERELADTRRRLDEASRVAAKAAAAENARQYVRPAQSAANADLCVVCLEDERTHVLIPCGHKCLCSKCAARYEEHMRFDNTGDGDHEAEDGDQDLKKGRGKSKGAAAALDPTSRRGAAASVSRSSPEARHTCPLCRTAVTAVHLVWE